jgi:methionyl-tRNA formyltransferase
VRILYFGNNRAGWQVLEWLRREGEEIVAVVVHPDERRAYGEEILRAADVRPECVFRGNDLGTATVEKIRALRPEIGISVYFGYILRPDLLSVLPRGCINLHPALLPYNRGAHPNVWSIVEGTPAGVTLHRVDAGVDTGEILAQREVEIEPADTGQTLYYRLETAAIELFQRNWGALKAGRVRGTPQRREGGTVHRARVLAQLDRIDLDRRYRARDLINLLRARTFPPHEGAYFEEDGRRIHLRLELTESLAPDAGAKCEEADVIQV